MVRPVAALIALNFDTLLAELTSVIEEIEESSDLQMFSFSFNINGKTTGHSIAILKKTDGSSIVYDPNGCPKVSTNSSKDCITILKNTFKDFIEAKCSQDPAEEIKCRDRILIISLQDIILSDQGIHSPWTLDTAGVSSFVYRTMLLGEIITLKDAQDVQKVIGYVKKINQEECLLSLQDDDEGLYLLPMKDLGCVLEESVNNVVVEPNTQLESIFQSDILCLDVSMGRLDLLDHETIFTSFWKIKEECQNVPLRLNEVNLFTMGAEGENFVGSRKQFQDFLLSAEGQSEKMPEKRGLGPIFKEFMISCALTQEAFSHQANEKTKGRLRMNHVKDITLLQHNCISFPALKEAPPKAIRLYGIILRMGCLLLSIRLFHLPLRQNVSKTL